MNKCVLERCMSDQDAKLFLEAELCAYCDGQCSICSAYCGGSSLTPDSVDCPYIPDAGADAADAATDASDSGLGDAVSDAAQDAGDAAGD
jgi:hypothetical protein